MTSYTEQKTRNLRTYLNECERASRKFSPFPVLSLLVNHIFVGAIPPVPPPPPLATLVGLMQLRQSVRARSARRTRKIYS